MTAQVITGTVNIENYTVYPEDIVADDALFNIAADARLVLAGDDDILNGGALALAGQLRARGPLEIDDGLTLENAVRLVNAASVTQNGGVVALGSSIPDAVTIRNLLGATWDLEKNGEIDGNANSRFVNFGLFEQTNNTGTNVVDTNFVNFGDVEAETGTLQFNAVTRLLGEVTGAGSFLANDAALIGTKISVAKFTVSGTANIVGQVICSSVADITSVALLGGRLLLTDTSGQTNVPTISGSGVVVIAGSARFVDISLEGDTTLINAGMITMGGRLGEGLHANPNDPGNVFIRNLPGANWNDVGLGPAIFFESNANATFVNLGTFTDSQGTDFDIPIVNNGLIEEVGFNAFVFNTTVTGIGTIKIGNGAVLANLASAPVRHWNSTSPPCRWTPLPRCCWTIWFNFTAKSPILARTTKFELTLPIGPTRTLSRITLEPAVLWFLQRARRSKISGWSGNTTRPASKPHFPAIKPPSLTWRPETASAPRSR